ncbi:primosomal protein N' [Gramella sp. AN32]|uniref:Replication restart protein PriA n=1 Tax=Christiangramia antarctica TaxID=2058158 RepID=A0ABW5XAG7_9FLAO|nr:primosomal protein N' [Gramella sp. AN32]MCM4156484.1 primosomal protein N' [Gramella sp. AN32]
MQQFVDLIFPIPLDNRFTYSISSEEADFLQLGMRVAAPFGKTKIYTGIVAHMHTSPPEIYEAKPIHQILDEKPLLSENQLKFWKWIASYYLCTEGDVMRAALPGAFMLESESIVSLNKSSEINESELSDEQFLVVEALESQSSMKIQEIEALLDKKRVLPIINVLVDKNLINLNQEIYEQFKAKESRYVQLNPLYEAEAEMHRLLDELSNAPKQREIVMAYFSQTAGKKKKIKAKKLMKAASASSSILKSLIEKNVFQEIYEEIGRVGFEGEITNPEINLNKIQQEAFNKIKSEFNQDQVCLLHGVTSSGKTEIYIRLIEEAVNKGKQALYLLPEIALTTQLIKRLQNYFGDKVLVYHSKYSVNERVEVYRHVLQNSEKGKIIIGARSCIFLPFQDLGLIVIDEEHESTYKQYDPAPRYQARDSAVVLAALFKANVIMGSATPSLESYYNALHNKYTLVELSKRFGNVLMPEVEVVDIKVAHRKKKMTGHFSERLMQGIKESLDENEQIILFQNRRGFSPILECNTCGHSPQCPNCDVSLTYHSGNNQLRCHYCGYHIAMQLSCMACGSNEISTKGFGTEQVETEIKALFPEVNVGRMDQDTTRGKYSYEKIIEAFENQETQILIGTQMLTKGLDFRNVGLVGIMNADNLLNFPDFRAHERSFQLMLQVAGRSGRTQKRGKVLIQTYNPHHQIIQQVSVGDYKNMYKEQAEDRYQYQYPPYFRLIRLTLKCRDYSKTNEAADWLARALENVFGRYVLGPEFPPVSRIRNEYYKNIMIKIPQKQSLGKTKEVVRKILNTFNAIGAFRSVRVIPNVDPQ